jgi:hypothetical protein
MLADANAAAVKDDLTFRIDGFIGNEHLRFAVGALHMADPG